MDDEEVVLVRKLLVHGVDPEPDVPTAVARHVVTSLLYLVVCREVHDGVLDEHARHYNEAEGVLVVPTRERAKTNTPVWSPRW